MKYKAIVFDWDGTLMDSVGKIVGSIQATAEQLALPMPSFEQAKNVIGISLLPALKQVFNIQDEQLAQTVLHTYKSQFNQHAQVSSPLFQGAINLLTSLKAQGYTLAVATGKARAGLEANMQNTQTKEFFAVTKTADDAASKPSPDMLMQILQELNLSAAEVLMVGDTTYDMAMAETLGVDRIAVSFGVHSIEQLKQHQPIAVIDQLVQLPEYL
ncbi:HAD family hydrolase [Paraglaciecola aestuariivivens]